MHSYVIPPILQSLRAMDKVLGIAEQHCTDKSLDPATLLTFRLFPDMFNFTRQVQLTTDFAVRCPARLTGADLPAFPDVETTFPELRDRVQRASDFVKTFDADSFQGAEDREIVLKLRSGEMVLKGQQYASSYALPQLFFHLTTAYNILRHNGVVLGKRDYMGAT